MRLDSQNKLLKRCPGVLECVGPGPWPVTVTYSGETYHRFHDFVYLLHPIEELTEHQVLTICRIRIAKSTRGNTAQNDRVRKKFRAVIDAVSPARILEVGPGNKPLYPSWRTGFAYELAELDQEMVTELATRGYSVSKFSAATPLHLASGSIDLIVAIFVLQFSIDKAQISEIARVLSQEGIILANVYRRSASAREQLMDDFKSCGLDTQVVKCNGEIGHDHEYWLVGGIQAVSRILLSKQVLLKAK